MLAPRYCFSSSCWLISLSAWSFLLPDFASSRDLTVLPLGYEVFTAGESSPLPADLSKILEDEEAVELFYLVSGFVFVAF